MQLPQSGWFRYFVLFIDVSGLQDVQLVAVIEQVLQNTLVLQSEQLKPV